MCGIVAVHGIENPASERKKYIACAKKVRHRGPDWSGCYVGQRSILAHERLAIVGVGGCTLLHTCYGLLTPMLILLESGAQPLISDDGKLILAVNGEIYNHAQLRAELPSYKFKTHSDCEIIIPLVCLRSPPRLFAVRSDTRDFQYRKYGKDICGMLDGMFSFVLLDESVSPTRVIASRDPIGITTLYQGRASSKPGVVVFASELKALPEECNEIISFPPGHVYDSQTDTIERYFKPTWWDTDHDDKIPTSPASLEDLRKTLEVAVKKRLMSEVPYGVLLSGGLDSSLIAAIAARETEKVAQAQAETRRKKLAEATSGPVTPTQSVISEYGTTVFLFSVIRSLIEPAFGCV